MLFRATPRIAILSRDNFANFVINTFVKWFLSSRKISLLFYFILFYRSGRVINGEINGRNVLDAKRP